MSVWCWSHALRERKPTSWPKLWWPNVWPRVNIITGAQPVQSVYIWEGVLQRDHEYLLLLKTLTTRLDNLEARVRELHSYTNPECIALPVIGGSGIYLDWVRESVS